MTNRTCRNGLILLAAFALVAAGLACGVGGADTPGAPPPTVTAYAPDSPTPVTVDTPAVPDTPVGGGGPADLRIADAVLSNATPALDEWVTVDVTIVNDGGAVATGYQLVVVPHYGVGPPNPGGFEDLPDIPPGGTHVTTITPGLLYPDVGSYTVRVLVTDDWYTDGNPDSTGTAGDIWDMPITVGPLATGPDLRITDVFVGNGTPDPGEWVTLEVHVMNQGSAAANDFDVVLIPHYGVGPPNPAGLEAIPSLAPGATFTAMMDDPGVLYPDAGTFTLRVLVTDDWYAEGNPDSTGSGGDVWDVTIVVGGR